LTFKKEKKFLNYKLKIAIIGCGRISRNHINAIVNENQRCDLIALCDPSKERIINAKNIFKEALKNNNLPSKTIKTYYDFDSLLEDHKNNKIKIDLIVLATPSGLHPIQTQLAAKAKIHVCTEKPMAINLEDGYKMVEICKKYNVKLFVVKQNRLNKTLQTLKKIVEEKKLGKIAIVTVNVFWQRPQEYYDQDDWRGTRKLDGGALLNQASHYVDLLDWIIGPIEGLSASIATIGRSIESEDTAVMQLKWKSGTLGTMAVTMITYPKNLEGSITIIGDKGSIRLGGIAVNKFDYCYIQDEDDSSNLFKLNYETESVYGYGHFLYYKNILDVLLDNKEAICDGFSGLSSIEIINAAHKSSKEKKYITLS
tara:strand:+ start:7180 stop:8283 length:1104 start_codon:yes stop_codon:yes gene_type:complete